LITTLACRGGEDTNKKDTSKSPPQITSDNSELVSKAESEEEPNNSTYVNERKNTPPQVTSIKIVSVSDNDIRQGFRAVVEAKDPDGDEVSFKYQWKRNGEDIIGAVDEVLEWQEDFKKGDTISVEVTPLDGKDEGVWKAEGNFRIPNSQPKIVSEPEERMEGGKFSYTVKAEDPDGDPIEFTLKNAPEGMTIEPATGVINWDFDESDTGEYRVEVIASDPEGAQAVQVLTLTIP
jgi:hypothetical protein